MDQGAAVTDRRTHPTSRRHGQGHGQGLLRWRLAGRLAATLPEVPDRVVGWVRGSSGGYAGPLRGRFADGMIFDVGNRRNASAPALSTLRFRPPALAPVLAAVLGPGDCCYDVGAGIGKYTLWAAGLVGPSGQVHAFEPEPDAMAVLESMVRLGELPQVRLESRAVGAMLDGTGRPIDGGASSLTQPVADAGSADQSGRTLDAYAQRHQAPALVKIAATAVDVLRGATSLLAARSPALLLEMQPERVNRGGDGQLELVARLTGSGYMIFNLTPLGLAMQGLFTSNVLALAPRWERFDRVVAALERTPFPRNQTT
jgi:FkbM family methyltransferase